MIKDNTTPNMTYSDKEGGYFEMKSKELQINKKKITPNQAISRQAKPIMVSESSEISSKDVNVTEIKSRSRRVNVA